MSQVKGLKEASETLSDAAESDREKKKEAAASEETEALRVQYGDSVTVEISGEAFKALAASQKEEQSE